MQKSDMPEIQVSFLSAQSSTLKNKDGAYIFYFNVTNLLPKRAKLFMQLSCYMTKNKEEIDQDYWLSGFGNGGDGFTLSGGSFKKIGCIYLISKLQRFSVGDKMLLTAWIANGSNNHEFIFECTNVINKEFKLLSSSLEPRVEDVQSSVSQFTPSKSIKEITKIIERLELLEEKFGIKISGLYANYEVGDPTFPHIVKINFDIASLSGVKLECSFKVIASFYNSADQLLLTKSTYIDANTFMGFSPISMNFFELDQAPVKIRLFPAA
jgi:hypothetical protein